MSELLGHFRTLDETDRGKLLRILNDYLGNSQENSSDKHAELVQNVRGYFYEEFLLDPLDNKLQKLLIDLSSFINNTKDVSLKLISLVLLRDLAEFDYNRGSQLNYDYFVLDSARNQFIDSCWLHFTEFSNQAQYIYILIETIGYIGLCNIDESLSDDLLLRDMTLTLLQKQFQNKIFALTNGLSSITNKAIGDLIIKYTYQDEL